MGKVLQVCATAVLAEFFVAINHNNLPRKQMVFYFGGNSQILYLNVEINFLVYFHI